MYVFIFLIGKLYELSFYLYKFSMKMILMARFLLVCLYHTSDVNELKCKDSSDVLDLRKIVFLLTTANVNEC